MVRWLAVAVALGAGACAGNSTKSDETPGDAGEGSGGTTSGGSSSGGASSGGAAPNGGTSNGGSSSGSANGGSANGGVATGGSANGGSATAGSGNGGSATAGSANGGGANASAGGSTSGGSAGAGGEPGECSEPNPAGCPQTPCPSETHRCEMSMPDCRPSQCTCTDGTWECTRDCGGGVCRPTSCPEGCEPSEGTCSNDWVSWVCLGSGGGWQAFQEGGCYDLGTQVPRFCCPTTFKPECRIER